MKSPFLDLHASLKKTKSDAYVEKFEKPEVVSTGIWAFDYVTSVGGLPKKRIVEIHGAESAGKTTVTLYAAAQAQKQGMYLVFFDYEQAFSGDYAKKLGVNLHPDYALVVQPNTLEEGEEISQAVFARAKEAKQELLVVIDSLPAMIPAALFNNLEQVTKNFGLAAKLTGAYFNDVTRAVRQTNSIMIVLNQMRANIQTMPMPGQPKEKATGTYAFKHFIGQSFLLKKYKEENLKFAAGEAPDDSQKKNDGYIRVSITNKKNKVGQPKRNGQMILTVGKGVDNLRYAVEAAIARGVIKLSGSWLKCEEAPELNAQGKDRLLAKLSQPENVELVSTLLTLLGWLQPDGTIDLFHEDSGEGHTDDDDDDEDENESTESEH